MFLGLISYTKLIILCALCFFGGFIDSIAGGGGVITLPAYLLTGLPPQMAFGTNKLSAGLGATVASVRYIRSKNVLWPVAIPSAVTGLIGARLAARIVLMMDPAKFEKLIVFVLPFVAVFLIFRKDFGTESKAEDQPMWRMVLVSAVIGLVIGFYDGLIGPGTGTFAILALTAILKIDLKHASGSSRIFNLASNIGSLIAFLRAGQVIIPIGLCVAACTMTGSFLGSGMAIKKDPAFIRIMLSVACAILMIKLAWDVFF